MVSRSAGPTSYRLIKTSYGDDTFIGRPFCESATRRATRRLQLSSPKDTHAGHTRHTDDDYCDRFESQAALKRFQKKKSSSAIDFRRIRRIRESFFLFFFFYVSTRLSIYVNERFGSDGVESSGGWGVGWRVGWGVVGSGRGGQ